MLTYLDKSDSQVEEVVWLARNHLLFMGKKINPVFKPRFVDYPGVGVQCSHLIQLLLMLSLCIKGSYANVWHQGVTTKQSGISPRVAV